MKACSFIFISVWLFLACQNGTTNRGDNTGQSAEERQTLPDSEQKRCFIRLDGNQQQDSTYLQLAIRGETVSGTYNYIPYEKDARRGTVLGTLDMDTLNLVWTFKQEGMQDTMRVVFLFDGEKLLRKSFSVDTVTGRLVTLDGSQFSEVYEPVDCSQ